MVRLKNTKVYGIKETIEACGLPYSKKGDIGILEKLGHSKIGSGHDTALKGILVQADITYPAYFSPQLQRYHWIDIISSESKMHTLTVREPEYNKYVYPYIIEGIQRGIEMYNREPSYERYINILSNLPMGYEMTMRISTNYLQLKTIYFQRRNHKLKEDWGTLCAWIEELPLFKELIL